MKLVAVHWPGPWLLLRLFLDPACKIEGLNDSKLLSAGKRALLYDEIRAGALAFGIGRAAPDEIDRINILQASLMAMKRAVLDLALKPHQVWVDGLYCPDITYPCQALVKGDQKMVAISAASILAKVIRDREMIAYDEQYPQYGFRQHKGYPTAQHRKALQEHGPCAIHRLSFAPVKRCMPV